MSVQNALDSIQLFRNSENKPAIVLLRLQDLVDYATNQDKPFTLDELKKALQIDWELRWIKYSPFDRVV
ncbi:hypothetical protein CLV59_105262 [Chitinophaga dinghuensis]|uniref:Uncharacterized protein n=1 Tax=Chitinophaga dinghuensis TaxID=1539050 RepID=A0A327VZB8_9BACT|nr:hypothetical protein [Chitinophaga dinghuensis]RAJ80154.1 hypothetical protein CLV59_105262 [Chitinophaga dinghuensis]